MTTVDRVPGAPVRTAVVGFGLGGAVFHAPLVEATPDLALTSIVTANPERAALARRRYPQTRVLPDVDALWAAADDHDLVVVTTPNRVHVPIALAAFEAGLHVVMDKPVAPSAAEARRAVSAAAERGLVFTVFQNRRWDGDFLTVRRLVDEGALGRVFRFVSRFERWRPEVDEGWRELGAAEEGGGLLLDLGAHLVDQAVRLFGPPTHVYAEVERRRAGAAVDDDTFLALRHRDGVASHLWMSAVAGSLGPRFRLLGTGGGYEKQGLDPQEAQMSAGVLPGHPDYGTEPPERWGWLRRGGDAEPVPTERGDYPRYYREVARAIRDGSPPPVPAEEAVAVLDLLEAARSAAATGHVLELP